MDHPNLSDDINRNLQQMKRDGGIRTLELREGDVVLVRTLNRLYHIEKHALGYFIEGHPKYCPSPTKCAIHGSTWGGSMLRIGWIGKGMHLEFSVMGYPRITTSQIESVEVIRTEGAKPAVPEIPGFKQYLRKQIAELRPYVPGESLERVSISQADRENGSPKEGDMIARNPKHHDDLWLVAAQYFADNFEQMPEQR